MIKMESLEERLGLKVANPEQVSEAVKFYNTSALLNSQGYELWIGKQFEKSENRNQFWKDKKGVFFVDYCHDLLHIAANLLSTTRSFVFEQKQDYEQSIMVELKQLQLHLNEIWNIYLRGGVDREAQIYLNGIISISNKEILEDVIKLQAKALRAYNGLFQKGIESADFKVDARNLIGFYLQVKQKYEDYDRQATPALKH